MNTAAKRSNSASPREFEILGLYLLNKISTKDACEEMGIAAEQLDSIKDNLIFTLRSEIKKSTDRKLEEYFKKMLSLHEQ